MDGNGPTVLIADDDKTFLDLAAGYLTAKGFVVHVVEDGLQATAQAAKLGPAVIVLDYDMPAASGGIVYGRLRQAAPTALIPVVFVTGHIEDLKREGIVENSKVQIVRKPAALADIEAAIRRLLPGARPSAAETVPAQEPARTPWAPPASTGGLRRVVVVDDDRTIRDLLRAELEAAGFEVTCFEQGWRAVEHLAAHPVDIVLLDVALLGESGLDVCRAIRAASGEDYIPVILLTALAGVRSTVEGLEAGADEYLIKPHNLPELLARIRSMLRLKDVMDSLRRADAFKEELLAVTAHDLRNPASAIQGFAEYLLHYQTTDDEEKRRVSLERIINSSEAMHRLLDRLYARTRLESAEFAAHRVPTDPATAAAAVVDRNGGISQAKGVRLEFESRLARDYRAPLDPGLFEEIVANLAGNALKFTPAGGLVRVTLSSQDGRLALAVADTGAGIPPEEQATIFTKFRRGAGSIPSEGMGYGLAIVAKFAKLHGGSVELASVPGKGSTFTVFFPEM